MNYQTLEVRFQGTVCFIKFNRPEANNTINDDLVADFQDVLKVCEERCSVIVLEGASDIFCMGADFESIKNEVLQNNSFNNISGQLYGAWLKLATGPYVSIAHVKGRANAGGVGFVAACDIVVAGEMASFSLSELLFGLFPACVLPFLIRKTGFQKAHYLTLMTKPVSAETAREYGLVDLCDKDSDDLLRKHLVRLGRLSKSGIASYKKYMNGLNDFLVNSQGYAVHANKEIFSNPKVTESITNYVENGKFPWEK